MHRYTALPILLSTLLTTSVLCAANSPPNFTVIVPGPFGTSVSIKHYRKGQLIFDSPPFKITTLFPMTEYHGWSGPRSADQPWKVSVYATFDPKVVAAYEKARDGFEADLDEGQEFLQFAEGFRFAEPFKTFARFKRKQFRWGDAVSFLRSSYQDMPDRGVYVPDKSHLRYEVWGVTRDQQYTVVASVSVSHPKLADWGPKVREVEDIQALKRDRDYRLIEECPPDQFKPSLSAFDRIVDSLEIQHTSGGENEVKSEEAGRN